jgi:hypothetical protein
VTLVNPIHVILSVGFGAFVMVALLFPQRPALHVLTIAAFCLAALVAKGVEQL